jgi:hypothetical protein
MIMVATVADSCRWLVIAEACLLFGFVVAILVEASKFRAPPRHIIGVAVSYLIVTAAYAFEIGIRLGDPFTYRIIVGLIAFAFGIWSMWEMYRHYSYMSRVRRHAEKGEEAARRMLERELNKRKVAP